MEKLEELMKEFDTNKIINDEINRLLEEFRNSELFKKGIINNEIMASRFD